MTKLNQFLAFLALFASLWLGLLSETIPIRLPSQIRDVLIPLPIYFLVSFGCFSLFYIGLKLIAFNDCVEASEALTKEIQEARKFLSEKGFKFQNA
jgi:dolichyl-phosphate mannosyltransferase polypeptide 3